MLILLTWKSPVRAFETFFCQLFTRPDFSIGRDLKDDLFVHSPAFPKLLIAKDKSTGLCSVEMAGVKTYFPAVWMWQWEDRKFLLINVQRLFAVLFYLSRVSYRQIRLWLRTKKSALLLVLILIPLLIFLRFAFAWLTQHAARYFNSSHLISVPYPGAQDFHFRNHTILLLSLPKTSPLISKHGYFLSFYMDQAKNIEMLSLENVSVMSGYSWNGKHYFYLPEKQSATEGLYLQAFAQKAALPAFFGIRHLSLEDADPSDWRRNCASLTQAAIEAATRDFTARCAAFTQSPHWQAALKQKDERLQTEIEHWHSEYVFLLRTQQQEKVDLSLTAVLNLLGDPDDERYAAFQKLRR